MKKLFILIALTVLVPMTVFAGNSRETRSTGSQILTLISEYSYEDGFEVVKVGGLGTSIIKKVIAASMDFSDPEQMAINELISGIKKVTLVEYDGCAPEVKSNINRKLDIILPKEDILMDIKEDGSSVRLYGLVSEEGGYLEDFILHAPDENAVICLFGSISMNALSKLLTETY